MKETSQYAWDVLRSSLRFKEITAPVTAQIPSNTIALYAKDRSGTSSLYFKDDAGTEHDLGALSSAAALTRVDDTNVTLTLGGSPTVALLAATSLTLGWTGTLAASRGGTGVAALGNVTAASTKITLAGTPTGASIQSFSIDVNQANLDHGSIGGLADDDHTGYALLAGRSGGQVLIGGTGSGDDLSLQSTSNSTKGNINIGVSSTYDDVNTRLGLNVASPTAPLHVRPTSLGNLTAAILIDGTQVNNGSDIASLDLGSTIAPSSGTNAVTGIYNHPTHSPGGAVTINTAIALLNRVSTGSGGGTVTSAYAGYFDASFGTVVPTNTYGINIENIGVSGATLSVGLRIADQAGSTTNINLLTSSIHGSTSSGGDLSLFSTSHATKGNIFFGTLSTYDQVNDRFGVGELLPDIQITVSDNGSNTDRGIAITGFEANTGGAIITARKTRGANAFAHTAVASGDILGNYAFQGSDGSAYQTGASIRVLTTENWTGSARGSEIQFRGTIAGTTTLATYFKLTDDGALGFLEGITEPAAEVGWSQVYVDTADSTLKVKYGDGTVDTLGGGSVTASSTTTFTNKTIDAEGTGNVITIPIKLWLPAAGMSGATAGTIWDLPTTNPAVAAAVEGTNTLQGVLDFADGANTLSAQTTFLLPEDFTGTVDARIVWFTSATSGDVFWQLATAPVANNESNDPAFNTASTVADTAHGTANRLNFAAITTLTITGAAAGELLHLKISRDPTNGSDTLAATARLVGVELTFRRAM